MSTQIGPDRLSYLAGNSQTAPTKQIFWVHFLNNLSMNPQNTIALTFLTHIISAIDGVY